MVCSAISHQRNNLMQRLWKPEQFKNSVSYLLGPYTVNNGVQHGWDKKIDVSHKYVYMGSHFVSKPVCEKREEGWGIGH
jgi:hypothetical protein